MKPTDDAAGVLDAHQDTAVVALVEEVLLSFPCPSSPVIAMFCAVGGVVMAKVLF